MMFINIHSSNSNYSVEGTISFVVLVILTKLFYLKYSVCLDSNTQECDRVYQLTYQRIELTDFRIYIYIYISWTVSGHGAGCENLYEKQYYPIF